MYTIMKWFIFIPEDLFILDVMNRQSSVLVIGYLTILS